jgi:hypothetical protein
VETLYNVRWDLAYADIFAALAEGLGRIKLSVNMSCWGREEGVGSLGCFETCKNSFHVSQRTHTAFFLT